MRTDTQPIAPSATDRHLRWPLVNDLESEMAAQPAPPLPVAIDPPPAQWRTRAATDAPLPAVGDLWDLGNPDPLPVIAPGSPVAPVWARRRTSSPLTTAALCTALVSVPLVLVLGLGGLTGLLAIALGAGGIRQVNRQPAQLRGRGRAVAAIVLGAGSALIGLPILLFVLVVAAVI